MLLVTAVLTTSAALGSVSEAFVLHEIDSYPSAIVQVDLRAADLRPAAARTDDSSGPTSIPGLGGLVGGLGATLTSVVTPVTSVVALDGVASLSSLTAPIVSAVSPVLSIPDAPPAPSVDPIGGVTGGPAGGGAGDPNELVQGTRFLQELSLQAPASLTAYVTTHSGVIAQVLAHPPAATEVTAWWGSLDMGMRNSLRVASPSLVGNLDGIPYSVRDTANRALLKSTMAQLRAVIAGDPGRTIVENAKEQLKMLQSISDALGGTGVSRSLLTLDVAGQGKAAIVLGDLRTADYVSYLVPGMFFTIENQMGDWVDAAANLYDEQRSWLALLDPDGAGKTVATVAWIGYHTPNLTNVGGIENADEGRDALASAIEGLQAIRTGDEPYTTVIAHSYGSTAALMALSEYDFHVDALAMVGSPGSSAKSVHDLHVTPGHVWVGEAAWDPIPNSSYFGSDPGSKSYGARSMGVGGGLDSLTKRMLSASIGHNEYFSAGSESMRNFALIAIDQGQYVTPAN